MPFYEGSVTGTPVRPTTAPPPPPPPQTFLPPPPPPFQCIPALAANLHPPPPPKVGSAAGVSGSGTFVGRGPEQSLLPTVPPPRLQVVAAAHTSVGTLVRAIAAHGPQHPEVACYGLGKLWQLAVNCSCSQPLLVSGVLPVIHSAVAHHGRQPLVLANALGLLAAVAPAPGVLDPWNVSGTVGPDTLLTILEGPAQEHPLTESCAIAALSPPQPLRNVTLPCAPPAVAELLPQCLTLMPSECYATGVRGHAPPPPRSSLNHHNRRRLHVTTVG